MTITWHEAKGLKAGDRVVFVISWDIYAEGVIVPEGTTAVVVRNYLGKDRDPLLYVLTDDVRVREALKDWDGEVQLFGPEWTDEPWDAPCPVARA